MKTDRHGYHKIRDGSRFVLDLDRELWLACCGCNLVHRFKFKMKDGKLVVRCFREESETRRLRKKKER